MTESFSHVAKVNSNHHSFRARLTKVPVDKVREIAWLPKRAIATQLVDLAKSIKARGDVDVPIKVRLTKSGDYELIWGHRRIYAAKLAGLSRISALVEDIDDEEALLQHSIENLHRVDKTPLEEAEIFHTWSKRFNRSYDEIARKLGIRREYIYNRVELLGLSPEVKNLLKTISSDTNRFGLFHARLLLKVKDPVIQYQFAKEAVEKQLTVRELARKISEITKQNKGSLQKSQHSVIDEVGGGGIRFFDITQRVSANENELERLGVRIEIIDGGDRFINYRKLVLPTHLLTHIDTPHLFFEERHCIKDYSKDKFIGSAYVAPVQKRANEPIDVKDIENTEAMVEADILLLYTGYSALFPSTEYYNDHPFVSERLARWIVSKGFRMVGIDTPSPEVSSKLRGSGFSYPIHKLLLSNDILIIENLGDMQAISGRTVHLVVSPLIIKDLDETPASVIASLQAR
ncbi:MAG: ParB/RepB/Spo0J family partition protein [Candidatus Caldarchaeum sp.]